MTRMIVSQSPGHLTTTLGPSGAPFTPRDPQGLYRGRRFHLDIPPNLLTDTLRPLPAPPFSPMDAGPAWRLRFVPPDALLPNLPLTTLQGQDQLPFRIVNQQISASFYVV